ncbi:Signal transduction histidine kinase CheA [Enhygromyxa salina]|uniref:histidine kinase n=1 Tax=Enhygromyxa salina TaxID=215803 RepID=A0A0C2CU79_9BACT|nr:chemotaxis protein CheA [Enhygromyxa salina]KIG13170.1 Signal transduction histidine kinase CheA [Enhygromyxa salina]
MSDSPEFVSEAQEIIETFSRQLLEIEGQIKDGDDYDPDLLNGSFRSVHTLKGLSSLSGVNEIVDLSHELETTLDALRLGKLPLNHAALDLMFESVELFQQLLASAVDPSVGHAVDVRPFLARLAVLSKPREQVDDNPLSWLDDSILSVLTEYEEHRLRENVRLNRRIFRVHASFDLMAIDVGIEALKGKLKTHGEVITYLPSADGSSDDRIELDILVGSKQSLEIVAEGIGEDGVIVEALGTGERIVISKTRASAPEPEPEPEPAPELERRPRAKVHVEMVDEDEFPPDDGLAGAGMLVPPPSASTLPFPDEPAPSSASSGAGRSAGAGAGPAGSGRDGGGRDGGGRDGGGRDGGGRDGGGQAGGEVHDDGEQVSLKSLSQTVRVDLRRLDHLMNLVGELALVHANLAATVDRMQRSDTPVEQLREFQDQLRVMNRRLGLLQQGILEVRMVPLGQVFDKLARVVRNLSRESSKDVRLAISGAETELDKLIVEELSDPLMHMIRNAIDHGIEKPAERVAVGKPRAGRVSLSAYQKGNRVVIEMTDDGQGMDWRWIRDKAIDKGVLTREEARDINASQAINLIFTPGFSTREAATEVSGRGFGMDVVKTNISRLSGMIDVASEPGRGSRFRITLPVTLAIIQALVIETAGQTFCIPLNSVLESIMVQTDEIQTIEGHEVVSVRGRTLPLVHLSRVFDLEPDGREADRRMFYDRLYVVVVGLAQHRVGLVVDELLGQQDVVIKPIGKALRQVPGIAGATELGDNRTVLLLDVGTLVGEAVGGVEAAVAGIGSGGASEGIGVFSSSVSVGRGKEHGGWGDHGY